MGALSKRALEMETRANAMLGGTRLARYINAPVGIRVEDLKKINESW